MTTSRFTIDAYSTSHTRRDCSRPEDACHPRECSCPLLEAHNAPQPAAFNWGHDTDLQLLQAAPPALAGGSCCCLLSRVPAGKVCLPVRKVKGNDDGCRNETMVAWARILPLGPLLQNHDCITAPQQKHTQATDTLLSGAQFHPDAYLPLIFHSKLVSNGCPSGANQQPSCLHAWFSAGQGAGGAGGCWHQQ